MPWIPSYLIGTEPRYRHMGASWQLYRRWARSRRGITAFFQRTWGVQVIRSPRPR